MGDFVKSITTGILADLPIKGDIYSTVEGLGVNSDGFVYTDLRKINGYVRESEGEKRSVEVTGVPWRTNILTLEEVEKHPNYHLTFLDDVIYAAAENKLYRSFNGLTTIEYFSDLPAIADNNPILKTPHGYFFKGENKVFRSTDLVNWTMEFQVNHLALYHMFDFWHENGVTYIFTGEYHTTDTERCKVYRGIYDDNGGVWKIVIDFRSRSEYLADPNNSEPFARHVHVVQIDQKTGDLYVNVGDSNVESKMFVSHDKGETFRLLGGGSQEWRSLSVWFTDNYVYWNMDSTASQSIWRVKRSDIPLQSPTNDLREMVALLDNGSHWYHCKAIDDHGDDLIIMSSSAEGQIRDKNARLFGIKENNDESVTIDELLVMQSRNPDVYISHLQIEPKFQDNSGFIYCRGRETEHAGIYKLKFVRKEETVRHNWQNPTTFIER